MTHKCSNERCPYGPHWDDGEPDPYEGDVRPAYARADSYSQHTNSAGHLGFDGLCLNCLDDAERYSSESDIID